MMFVPGTKITAMVVIRNIRSRRIKARFVCVDGPDGVIVATLIQSGQTAYIRGSLGLPRYYSDDERRKAVRATAEGYRRTMLKPDSHEVIDADETQYRRYL